MGRERDRTSRVGIDAGATLWKLARLGDDLELAFLPAGAIDEVRRRLADWQPNAVHLTGGGAARIAAKLGEDPRGRALLVRQVSEFDAWHRGAALLAARAGWSLPRR